MLSAECDESSVPVFYFFLTILVPSCQHGRSVRQPGFQSIRALRSRIDDDAKLLDMRAVLGGEFADFCELPISNAQQ